MPADRGIGADHLPAPFHRHPDRRLAGCFRAVAVSGGRAPALRLISDGPPTRNAGASAAITRPARVLCLLGAVAGTWWHSRHLAGAALAGDCAGHRRLRLFWRRRENLPERRGRPGDLASRWLLWPYRIVPGSMPGPGPERSHRRWRSPTAFSWAAFRAAKRVDPYAAIVDLAAEFERPAAAPKWTVDPNARSGHAVACRGRCGGAKPSRQARQTSPGGKVLVCCALGFQRSARVVARWLVLTGRAPDEAAAIARITACGRPVVLHPVSPLDTAPA